MKRMRERYPKVGPKFHIEQGFTLVEGTKKLVPSATNIDKKVKLIKILRDVDSGPDYGPIRKGKFKGKTMGYIKRKLVKTRI